MLIIRGQAAFSTFRLKKLTSEINNKLPGLSSVKAEVIYFADLERHLLAQEEDRLMLLLSGEGYVPTIEREQVIIVMPRFGTISPWSSKATEILHQCGLTAIHRVERAVRFYIETTHAQTLNDTELELVYPLIHDAMTQTVGAALEDGEQLFEYQEPSTYLEVDVLGEGLSALETLNDVHGLGLTEVDCNYLVDAFKEQMRNPSLTELMMYAQVNSEHCRHKIFNASWKVNGEVMPLSLFSMIKNTYQPYTEGVLSAYKDNAAVIRGVEDKRLLCCPETRAYEWHHEPVHIVMKVETHNHPTAISPYPGAATGVGGEIRDEGATGIGAKPKAGLAGFNVSHLRLPDNPRHEEKPLSKPKHIASSLDIMLDAPIGAANYNNEFGRPNLCGYFRVFEQDVTLNDVTQSYGYHKPIMIAGGYGNIRPEHVEKKTLQPGMALMVLGGPAMLIGLGGGSASSMQMAGGQEQRDFASVQRDNPEMERRAQEVINACVALGKDNPIISIHDVGAGGLSNALPEIIHDADRGGRIELRAIPVADYGLSPMAIWCNESQERYVLAVNDEDVPLMKEIAVRERCPLAVVGEVTQETQLLVGDSYFDAYPIDIPMDLLFSNAPKLVKQIHTKPRHTSAIDLSEVSLTNVAFDVLSHPTVADKSFLITIGDRTVGGLTVRDQMVGPWQVPVADCAVTAVSFGSSHGEAMAVGERAPLAVINPAASARMAVAEAITNLCAARIEKITDIKLSANWMAACQDELEQQALYEAVEAIAMDLCPKLGLTIPVGKDSLSMQVQWQVAGETKHMKSPLSCVISAFSPVHQVKQTLTPQCQLDEGESELLLIDCAKGKQRLGASVLASVIDEVGDAVPDVDEADVLYQFFQAIQTLAQEKLLLAYHDKSDGGLFACVSEMAFAAKCGLELLLDDLGACAISSLFNEEYGAVIQIRHKDKDAVFKVLAKCGLAEFTHVIGCPKQAASITIRHQGQVIFDETLEDCHKAFSTVSFEMCKLRDNPTCAHSAYEQTTRQSGGLPVDVTFDINDRPQLSGKKPRIAILREQGINGYSEMAAAFMHAGFEAVDVHMSDILLGLEDLATFQGLAVCGGFSFGDVLGAGRGFAATLLFHEIARDVFAEFFARNETFTLGVCNGCQMLSQCTDIIPGTDHWPTFVANQSERFEARLSAVKIGKSRSVLFNGMQESILPVVVAHGEGRVDWGMSTDLNFAEENEQIVMRYVDHERQITECYPHNPNGSSQGVTGLCSEDGRVTILMPHPERVFLTQQLSWHPKDWPHESPWIRLFDNARRFCA